MFNLSQMSVEPQLGDFKILVGFFGGGVFVWVFFSPLSFIVYCWKTCGEQYYREEQRKMLLC